MVKVGIIGGGACGLICAGAIKKQNTLFDVYIIEKGDRVGKKIITSGNGVGNLSNVHALPESYNNPEFVTPILTKYNNAEILSYFRELGLETRIDEEGRCYPVSDTSSSIVDILRLTNDELGVNEITNAEVTDIVRVGKQYSLVGSGIKELFDVVVIATGSNAGLNNKTYSIEMEKVLKKFGHTFTKQYPALSPLPVVENIKGLSGLHQKAEVSLFINGNLVKQRNGEVLFKDNSLSGIVMFEMSSAYARARVNNTMQSATIEINLIPNDELHLSSRVHQFEKRPISTLFTGVFNKMIGMYILKQAGIFDLNMLCGKLKREQIRNINLAMTKMTFHVDTNSLPNINQIFAGGVTLSEINPSTFESKIIPNIYLGGEIINIDGDCGGYNLHFAWASGKFIADAIVGGEC